MSREFFRGKILFLLASLVLTCSTSCVDLFEKIRLNKDGSGKYTLTIKPGIGLIAAYSMEAAFKDSLEEETDLSFDSTFNYSDCPDSVKSMWSNPEIMERAYSTLHVKGSDEWLAGTVTLEVHFDFNSLSELRDFHRDISYGPKREEMMEFNDGKLLPWDPPSYALEENKFTRALDDLSAFNAQPDRDKRGLMALYKQVDYELEIILPGKVKSTSNDEYDVKGKSVTIAIDLDELYSEEISLGTEITFK